MNNGTFTVRTFNGTTMGQPSTINLNGLQTAPPTTFVIPGTTTPIPSFATHLANMTGLFFDNGRIYYTVSGNPPPLYRYFTPQSQVVGANLFVAKHRRRRRLVQRPGDDPGQREPLLRAGEQQPVSGGVERRPPRRRGHPDRTAPA